MTPPPPRGGARKGAGRPAPDGVRVTLAVRVLPVTRILLEQLAEISDMSMGEVIDGLVGEVKP